MYGMDVVFVLLALAFAIAPFAAIFIALSALNRARGLEHGLIAVRRRLDDLTEELRDLADKFRLAGPPGSETAFGQSGERPETEVAPIEPVAELGPPSFPAVPETPIPEAQEAARTPRVAKSGAPIEPAPAHEGRGVEETLTSQWMVWLGAIAVGLSAVFLFTYAIEQGWLGPRTRVVLGILLGGALIAAGEWMHYRPVAAMGRAVSPDYVPPALSASGLFALYVSLYAAHGLYGLLGAAGAFVALAIVSFAGLGLALRQGWFVAMLGLSAGYLTPWMLESETSDALPVFLYIFVLTGGCLALMVYRKWWFLAFATIAGAFAWPLLWLVGPWTLGDQGVLGAYTVGVAALFALFSVGLPVKLRKTPATAWLARVLSDTSGLGFALSGALVVVLALTADFNGAAFVFLGLYTIVGLLFGLRRATFEGLGVIAAIVIVAAFLIWPQPADITTPEAAAQLGVDRFATAFGPYVMPPEFFAFSRALLAFGAIFGFGGFAALRRGSTPGIWAALSAAMPLYLLVMGYWRIGAFEVDVQWAALAVGLSLLNLVAAGLTVRMVGEQRRDVPLSFYAAGCTAALALAFTCLLREAWLTVALSLEVLALAWIWARLQVVEIRAIIYVAAVVVITRLVLNYQILDYEGGVLGLFSWVVYGYGLPALAFLSASRFLGAPMKDPLAALCQIAAIGFAFLMVALQLRIWTSGAIDDPRYNLFDLSVQSLWWLVAAGMLLRKELDARLPQAWYGGAALLALASLQIAFGQVLGNNPAFQYELVGDLPLLNLLGLAYLAPALLLLALSRSQDFAIADEWRRRLMAGAGVLVFVYVTLEVRRAFWGTAMVVTHVTAPTNAEIYAYSAVWIVFALILLAVGVLQKSPIWRYASLAVLIVTVLKVFLYDMSDLTGLYRVASFLALGVTLIGIGHIYRRLVFR